MYNNICLLINPTTSISWKAELVQGKWGKFQQFKHLPNIGTKPRSLWAFM